MMKPSQILKSLKIPDGYSVLFMTGGATAQFALAPMNLLGNGKIADYTNSGTWATKAIKEAKLYWKRQRGCRLR